MWKLSGNLKVVSADIKKALPRAVIYSIGDQSHRNRRSDHNPDSRGIVCAIDVMIRDGFTKSHAAKLAKNLLGRSDIAYVIYNHRIWSAAQGWRSRYYSGSDPHTDHVHVSSDHTSSANRTVKHLTMFNAIAPVRKRPRYELSAWPFKQDRTRIFKPYLDSRPPHYETIEDVQRKLWSLGYTVGSFDGRFGPVLRRALMRFQRLNSLTMDGILGYKSYSKLRSK